MEIPYTELSSDTLRSLIEEFVSREGTDYGQSAYTIDDKVRHVMRQLENKQAYINYDADSTSCNIVLKQ
tara:strand:+ start:117263 stop:117469 length:207 start_codon:yes stop_codon:yes gene_type:complete